MKHGITLLIALLLVACVGMEAKAESQSVEMTVQFTEVQLAGQRICHAALTLPVPEADDWKKVELRFLTDCSAELGDLALGEVSLWSQLPQNPADVLAARNTRMGLVFQAEAENEHKTEIASSVNEANLLGQTAVLAIVFDCAEVGCACEPLIGEATLSFWTAEEEGP